MKIIIKPFNITDTLAAIKDLVADYQYNDLRRCRLISKKHRDEYLLKQIINISKDINSRVLVASVNSKVVGLLSFRFLAWDTKHFGHKMGYLDHIVTKVVDYNKALEVKESLLCYLLALCRKKSLAYLSCKVDTEDMSSLHVLGNNGFKIVDTAANFIFYSSYQRIPDIRTIYRVREFRKSDLASLVKIAKSSFLRDRFHLDQRIPKEKADSLYGLWVKNNASDGTVFVAVKSNRPVGFFTYKTFSQLASIANCRIAGEKSLMAVNPAGKGAIISLVKAALEDARAHYDGMEFPTHLNNYEAMRLFQRFNLRLVRTKHVFYKWL